MKNYLLPLKKENHFLNKNHLLHPSPKAQRSRPENFPAECLEFALDQGIFCEDPSAVGDHDRSTDGLRNAMRKRGLKGEMVGVIKLYCGCCMCYCVINLLSCGCFLFWVWSDLQHLRPPPLSQVLSESIMLPYRRCTHGLCLAQRQEDLLVDWNDWNLRILAIHQPAWEDRSFSLVDWLVHLRKLEKENLLAHGALNKQPPSSFLARKKSRQNNLNAKRRKTPHPNKNPNMYCSWYFKHQFKQPKVP